MTWGFKLFVLLTILNFEEVLAGIVVELVAGSNVSLGQIDAQIRIGDLKPIESDSELTEDMLRTSHNNRIDIDEQKLIDLFTESFRNHPPLDPLFYKKNIKTPIHNAEFHLDGHILFSNLVIKGLRNFVIDEISIDGRRTDFSVTVPLVTAKVDLRADFRVLEIIQISCFGHVTAYLESFHVDDSLRFEVVHGDDKDVYQLAALHANASADDLILNTRNIKLDPYETTFDSYVSGLDRTSIGLIKKELEKSAGNFILSTVNSLLMGYSVNEVFTQ